MNVVQCCVLSFCLLLAEVHCAKENNVCPTFEDYRTVRKNSNCWYDFAADSTAPDIIYKNGYPVMQYRVTTQDGYILKMFRIPNFGLQERLRREPVFLIHGIACSCTNFISLGRKSLAFLLSDLGYDVWLGNFRGNEYSQEHVNLTVYDKQFWDHTTADIGVYDVPAMLKLILYETKSRDKIIYIGHSLGTTIALMYSSTYPEEARRIVKMFILMSPSYTLTRMRSPFRVVAPFYPLIKWFLNRFRAERLISQAKPARDMVKQVCLESVELMKFCMQMTNLFFGPFTQTGPEMIPVIFNQLPAGTALEVWGYLASQMRNMFKMKDYGWWNNYRIYGSRTPPDFDMSKIRVPSYIIYSVNDWTTTKEDALNLYSKMSPQAKLGIYEVNVTNFNHLDFLFGRHAKELVYDHVINLIQTTYL